MLAWLIWLAMSCADPLPGQGRTIRLMVDSSIVEELEPFTLDSIEHFVCLYGSTGPDSVVILAYAIPKQTALGTHNVSVAKANMSDCGSALMLWHNHPVPKDSVETSYLYLSLTDERTFMQTANALGAIVATPNYWCTWSRLQIRAGDMANYIELPPVSGQCFR